ncbi:Glycine-zipper containing OmpA-like membrane domain-containing protein [Aquiflexum balticum DSM 16537]|uniref:Glycine-zipper containing OmpA-like membrane domain-containing protein n=1 Tax=Aquiflexum balticum DSM 16537 TaxID=758820 RepID=A0A1W2H7D1_9BACT|nr:glycine zipper domain-containing protein [Aquiflexum balticum]SMD44769.1 Glycine-zipper containing OmpA-like membrane domain-containing protein [Aquiflexum balticum DSM 16537]
MKDQKLFREIAVAFIMLFAMSFYKAYAQVPTMQAIPDTTKITYNQISQSLGLFVFPSKNQSQNQQKQDEFECYKWAVDQSGIDPQNIPKIEVTDSTGPTGGAVIGSAKGAAAGAAIGAIAGDAGKGAAIGATAGALRGRRAGQQAQAQQNQKAHASASAQETAMLENFKKAFSVCIEGKGYTIK